MKSRPSLVCTAACAVALIASGASARDPGDAAKETAAAQAIAAQPGEDFSNLMMLCRPPQEQYAKLRTFADPPPTKVFDNLYFVGRGSVSAWAITTSAGIILIDTLDNSQEADDFIIGGLTKLGLDPMSIKYVLVTHGHFDHFGGASELQKKIPGVRVLMSGTDYAMAEDSAKQPNSRAPAPARDLVVQDGQKLTLGDETITLYITPGHTPGTVSALIPVRDHGKPYMMALFGGSTFTPNQTAIAQFAASLQRFRGIMAANNVAGRMSNHGMWDNSSIKLKQIADNPGGPNPYLETPQDMARYAAIQDHCMRAQIDLLPDAG